ncbi:unnamed protein product [Rotaria sp. Silwood2]|nr:unnamed protein product [Rotaria sp. Silwood2]
MPCTINPTSQQFNRYKFIELSDKLLPLIYDVSSHQKQIGLEALQECCWTWNLNKVSHFWQQQYNQPKTVSNCLSLLHYNIRHFYSNQVDLIEMVNTFSPTIISLNELGTPVLDKTIKQLLFSYNFYTKEGTNPHGGVVLAVDKRLQSHLIETALKLRVAVWQEVSRTRPSISSSLRILLRHKHYLQNRYRHTTYEEDRLRLRSWNTLVRLEFQAHRQRSWEQFISSVASPNPTNFWRTVKKLDKKKSIEFSALTDNNTVHRSPEDVVKRLEQHFTQRYSKPVLNMMNKLDKEATEIWESYRLADEEDMKLVSGYSNLQFTERDIKNTIQSLKCKNSSVFDQVSNKMIKLLPAKIHATLTLAYNKLFEAAHWGKEWKMARTKCLNKCDNPAPRTNQLRPISMLPTFSKMYEKLFLLRFNSWSQRMNILPAQQSGARTHQATTSRVNHLLEQITQSIRYNTFAPVIYIDFLQAFDMLWQK